MKRSWSIRVRTAVVFAVASMLLTAAVLVFVNVASQSSLSQTLIDDAVVPATRAAPTAPDTPTDYRTTGVGDPDTTQHAQVAVIAQVSELQWQWSAVGIGAAGLLAGALGWFLSRRMLRPIDRITATTTRISASNLHERIALGGADDELRRLSATIDSLLDRLETAFISQRRFVAQASHELRTPLAVQRAAIQIGLPDDASAAEIATTREQLLDHNRRTEELVESLLVLAEAERGLDERRQPLDLVALAAEVTATLTESARTAGVTLTCRGRAEPPGRTGTVRGEPTLVRQVVANLVDNAIEYNHPGGRVDVRIDPDGFEVENTGPTVPESVAATLVEPFRRHGDGGTRRHSGLGLSIVAAVVRAHGWQLSVDPCDGGGLRVRVDVSSV